MPIPNFWQLRADSAPQTPGKGGLAQKKLRFFPFGFTQARIHHSKSDLKKGVFFMKKMLTSTLAILILFALFSGSGTNQSADPASPTDAAQTDAAQTAATQTAAPTEDSPYRFAPGKYEVNEKGYPTAPYEYELPLSTTDEVFSFWTSTNNPELIPEEGFESLPQAIAQQEITGVNIEYVLVTADARQQNYSVLLAADDLCDIMASAVSYTTESFEDNIENEYWVNLYDYMEYCPNYIYQATYDPLDTKIYNTVFYKKDMIVAFYALQSSTFVGTNMMVRGDWLSDMGLTNDDIVTWDDVYELLVRFKTSVETCEFPITLINTIDMAGNYAFCSYDTLPYVNPNNLSPTYTVNGKVTFSHINTADRDFMTLLNQWCSEGLLDPNITSYTSTNDFMDKVTTSQTGMIRMSPGEVEQYEESTTNDSDAQWIPIHKPLKTPDQVLHLGCDMSRIFYGSSVISAKCENIPLIMSWCDWRYSISGSFAISFGPEGYLWERNENGDPVATDFSMNNPDGVAYAWLMMFYGLNSLTEHGMVDQQRRFITPEGQMLQEMSEYWAEYEYDGLYEWNNGVKLTQEQTDEVTLYANDIVSYINENYLSFIDGSKPLSEWDTYVSGFSAIGLDRVIEIYQQAYDDFMASQAE
jgi:putative aldouronate transport system substrate-binding protein